MRGTVRSSGSRVDIRAALSGACGVRLLHAESGASPAWQLRGEHKTLCCPVQRCLTVLCTAGRLCARQSQSAGACFVGEGDRRRAARRCPRPTFPGLCSPRPRLAALAASDGVAHESLDLLRSPKSLLVNRAPPLRARAPARIASAPASPSHLLPLPPSAARTSGACLTGSHPPLHASCAPSGCPQSSALPSSP